MHRKYTPPKFDKTRKNKRVTVPDQSLSIQEIVRRYTRGVNVDDPYLTPVYVDQNTHDLEKITRMDVLDKTELARQIRTEFNSTLSALEESKAEQEAEAAATQKATHRNASDDDDEGEGGRQHGERGDSRKASTAKARKTGSA